MARRLWNEKRLGVLGDRVVSCEDLSVLEIHHALVHDPRCLWDEPERDAGHPKCTRNGMRISDGDPSRYLIEKIKDHEWTSLSGARGLRVGVENQKLPIITQVASRAIRLKYMSYEGN